MIDLKHIVDALFVPWGLMMVPRRREEDEGGFEATQYLKPLGLPAATVVATVLGVNFGPVEDVQNHVALLTDSVHSAREELVLTKAELAALRAKVDDISSRRSQQVSDLEKRILACELTIAKQHGGQK